MTKTIDPGALYERLLDGSELALIDVREQGIFAQDHLLLAVNIPLSRLDIDCVDMMPRRTTPVVLCDGGDDGLAERAAVLLAAEGWQDVAVLEGGTEGWREAGYVLFSGVNVPSKLFGEYVEHRFDTPRIAAADLKARLDAGDDIVVLDSRPADEFHNMSIPGGIDTPGAELVYRVRDLAPDPATTVVVNCAGRTRSIIGCQSLVNAGVPNPVLALENGTMGWHLAGLELEHGAQRHCGPVSEDAAAWAEKATAAISGRFGVRTIDRETLLRWWDESDQRTLYVLDVRFPEEFAAGHLPGSRSAPGGQLVQATDRYIATRNARIVLVDDTGVRARMTASWLVQMGWTEAVVLEGGVEAGLGGDAPESGARSSPVAGPTMPTVDLTGLREELDAGEMVLIDCADSITYRTGHILGAHWAIRSRLEMIRERIPEAPRYIVCGPEINLCRFMARDLGTLTGQPVSVFEGGVTEWQAAGHAVETGFDRALDKSIDRNYRAYDPVSPEEDVEGAAEAAMNRYLEWEIALVDLMAQDGTLVFPEFSS